MCRIVVLRDAGDGAGVDHAASISCGVTDAVRQTTRARARRASTARVASASSSPGMR